VPAFDISLLFNSLVALGAGVFSAPFASRQGSDSNLSIPKPTFAHIHSAKAAEGERKRCRHADLLARTSTVIIMG